MFLTCVFICCECVLRPFNTFAPRMVLAYFVNDLNLVAVHSFSPGQWPVVFRPVSVIMHSSDFCCVSQGHLRYVGYSMSNNLSAIPYIYFDFFMTWFLGRSRLVSYRSLFILKGPNKLVNCFNPILYNRWLDIISCIFVLNLGCCDYRPWVYIKPNH